MPIILQNKYRLRHFTMVTIFVLLIFYLAYHAVNGERGVLALLKLSRHAAKLEEELDNTRTERLRLEHRVNLMRSESLDLDLLDEQSRKILGYSGEQEVVYFIDKENALHKAE
jgi:cell division protein FtsB